MSSQVDAAHGDSATDQGWNPGSGAVSRTTFPGPDLAAPDVRPNRTPPASLHSGGTPVDGASTVSAPSAGATGAEDRAVAVGLLLDSAPPSNAIDRGLSLAEALRRRYNLDSGDPLRDREEAASRVQRDLLDRLEFTEEEIRGTAASLGFGLDADRCGNTCENVRNLAILELQKLALEAFAEGRRGPGHYRPEPAVSTAR